MFNSVFLLWAAPIRSIVGLAGATSTDSTQVSSSSLPQSLQGFFRDTLREELKEETVWEQVPLIWRNVEGVDSKNLFSFDDAVSGAEGGLLDKASVAKAEEAATGVWVSEYAPSTSRDQLKASLKRGTVFFNGAGLDYPNLADLSMLSQEIFGLPANVNVYITKQGQEVSVCPHTDSQNVLIFQTSGRKRWRVWAPPIRRPGKDPFNRGKNGDRIDMSELEHPPIIDTWLEPGSVLYVPIGFPHATSTAADNESDDSYEDETSCHVTLNIDTYFYGLSLATLQAVAAAREGSQNSLNPSKLDDVMHRKLFSPLPLGFLCPEELLVDNYGDSYISYVIEQLKEFNRKAAVMCSTEETFLGEEESMRECVKFIIEHWKNIMTPSKYKDVIQPPKKFTPASIQANILKNSKNRREESQLKKLGAFAATRRRKE